MRIVVRSNFRIEGLSEEGVLEVKDGVTLRDVVRELGSREKIEFVDSASGEVDTETFALTLNGLEYQFLPQRLESRLKAGDEVRLNVVQMAGG